MRGRNRSTPSPLLLCYPRQPVSLVVTCAPCDEVVLEAEVFGHEEECLLRDRLLLVHPRTIQPETLGVLLRHFVVTESPAPAA